MRGTSKSIIESLTMIQQLSAVKVTETLLFLDGTKCLKDDRKSASDKSHAENPSTSKIEDNLQLVPDVF